MAVQILRICLIKKNRGSFAALRLCVESKETRKDFSINSSFLIPHS